MRSLDVYDALRFLETVEPDEFKRTVMAAAADEIEELRDIKRLATLWASYISHPEGAQPAPGHTVYEDLMRLIPKDGDS